MCFSWFIYWEYKHLVGYYKLLSPVHLNGNGETNFKGRIAGNRRRVNSSTQARQLTS